MKNDFSIYLRRLLDDRLLSLRELGKTSGIDHATLSKIMNGKRKVNITHLQKLSASLDIELTTLLEAAGFTAKPTAKKDGEIQESVELIQKLMKTSNIHNDEFTVEKIKQEIVHYQDRSQTKNGREHILQEFQNKLQKMNSTGPFITQLKTMYSRFSAKEGTAREMALIGAALLYFIITTDMIPDYLMPIGLLDDALIMQTISQHLENKRAL